MNAKLVTLIITFLLIGVSYAIILHEVLKLQFEISLLTMNYNELLSKYNELEANLAKLMEPPPLWYDELCLWLPLDGDFKDYSPKNQTVIPFGNPVFVDGISGQAIYLDGIDDYISVSDAPEFSIVNNPQGMTISFWMSPASHSFFTQNEEGYVRWLGKGIEWCFTIHNASGDRAYQIGFYVHNATGGLGIGTRFQEPWDVNEWVFITAVMDGKGLLHIYKNGVYKWTSYNYSAPNSLNITIVPEDTNTPLTIGRRFDVEEYFYGRVDDVRLYTRALSNNEILALYRSYFADRTHLFQIYVGYNGKIASFQRNDTSLFYLNLTEVLNDERTIIAINVRGVRVSGSGGLYTYPNEGGYPLAIGHSSFSSWIIIKYGTNRLPLYQSVANDSWDVYCYGYVIEAKLP
ncbi:MAG: LamG domain-containing protein [Candidatus Bathyarchaeota archaeon]|jgi:hypothetical protein|nr:LamG domain-containing protein [Candidatus Bathyarchaeota archaeon]